MTGRVPLAAVLGHPIAHSRSPRLHGHWLQSLGIAGHYIPIDVAPDGLPKALEALKTLGFVGANVTIPHKETALRLADSATERARRIGAANTLVFGDDGRIHADNTDGQGFIQNLHQNAPGWSAGSGPALVFGAGGAARAIIVAVLDAGAPGVVIANRTADKATRLAGAFGDRVTTLPWEEVDAKLGAFATVINTTSLGMVHHPPLPFSLKGLHHDQLVTDIVYTPLETELLQTARMAGCAVVDGLGMLLHQAVPGFEAWFGARPEVDAALRAVVLA